jgi:NADH-quinone oxidoreductase subunit E
MGVMGLSGPNGDRAQLIRAYEPDPRHLLAILQDLQEREKYLSVEAMKEVAAHLGVPESRVYAVATFYKALSLQPKGNSTIKVCMGTACHLRGAGAVLASLERALGVRCGETTEDGRFTLETVNCVGACAMAPVVMVGERTYGGMTSSGVAEMLERESGHEAE